MPENKHQFDALTLELENYKTYYSDFIERAAHDLQTPVRKIAVLTERLISKYQDEGDEQQYINRIRACMTDMYALIEGFVELATFIPGNMHISDCDLSQLVKQGLQPIGMAVSEKDNALIVKDMPVIEGDKLQLRQLFKKIIDNAYHFRKKNVPLKITVSSLPVKEKEKKEYGLDKNKVYHHIEIKDNGIGFKPEDAENLFKPFFYKSPKGMNRRSGLGLTIAKQIIRNHKGIVFAVSGEDEGSRIVLILPEKN